MSSSDEHSFHASGRVAIALATLAAFGGALSGCSTRSDPHFNAYRAPNTAPAIMRRADGVVGTANEWLDNLDARMENAIR